MTQVDANPDDLDRFAKQVAETKAEIEQVLKQLQGQFARLEWKDRERTRFEGELSAALRGIRAATNQLDPLPGTLRRKAQHLRAFLGR